MTKQEFIQQAALILLQRESGESVDYLADYTKKYADAIYELCEEQEDPEEPEVSLSANPADYENDRLLDTVFREMERLERMEKEEEKKKYPGRRVQVTGNAIRFINAAKYNDIETVGRLLEVGSRNFENIRNVGRRCVEDASVALKNLYGIEIW